MAVMLTNGTYAIDCDKTVLVECRLFRDMIIHDPNLEMITVDFPDDVLHFLKLFMKGDIVCTPKSGSIARYMDCANYLGYDDLFDALTPPFLTDEFKQFYISFCGEHHNFIQILTIKEFNYICDHTKHIISGYFRSVNQHKPCWFYIQNMIRAKLLLEMMYDCQKIDKIRFYLLRKAIICNYLKNINSTNLDAEITYILTMPNSRISEIINCALLFDFDYVDNQCIPIIIERINMARA